MGGVVLWPLHVRVLVMAASVGCGGCVRKPDWSEKEKIILLENLGCFVQTDPLGREHKTAEQVKRTKALLHHIDEAMARSHCNKIHHWWVFCNEINTNKHH